MTKLDLTKKYKSYYSARIKPELTEIEKAQFLSICGKGDPSGSEFAVDIQALYATAYTLKFLFKAENKDFVVAKLEGLWWFDEKKYAGFGIAEAHVKVPRSEWEYRLLIRMPDFVTNKYVQASIQDVIAKKEIQRAAQIELHIMTEGKVVQMLHIGSFDKEPVSLAQMLEFIESQHLKKNGLHHEIYLSDFRKTAPEKLKTILREPVR